MPFYGSQCNIGYLYGKILQNRFRSSSRLLYSRTDQPYGAVAIDCVQLSARYISLQT